MLKVKKDFPIFKNNKNLIYLDSAATSQKPQVVIDVINNYYQNYNSNIHRGLYPIAERSTHEVEKIRSRVAKFINAASSKEIIFVRNATEAINLVAYAMSYNIKKGDSIITTIVEHHANFVPWQQLCLQKEAQFVVLDINENFQFSIFPAKQNLASRDNLQKNDNIKTAKLLAITHVSNVLGIVNPIKEIIKQVRKINPSIKILVDGAQAVPHVTIDVQNLDADFYVFSGHKMLAGTGIGILYAKKDLLEKMPPFLYGGNMIRGVDVDKTTFADLPNKFEAGTLDIAGIVSLGAAIDYLEKIGMDKIQEHEKELVTYCLSQMSKIEGLTIYGFKNSINNDDQYTGILAVDNKSGIISFNLTGIHPHDIAQILGDMNICIRAGHHCAMPLHKRLGVSATARVSLCLYNDKKDVDKFVNGIKEVKKIFKV